MQINTLYNVGDSVWTSIYTESDTWFVGIDKRDKHAYMFNYSDLNTILFAERKDALDKVKAAEKNKIKISEETDYEEY